MIAHDGFTLYDLCAYNEKRNQDNGEQNRDGCNDNFGWNCGAEGETQDEAVNFLRKKQMRNLMVALMVSQGTPMVLAGVTPFRLLDCVSLCVSSQPTTLFPTVDEALAVKLAWLPVKGALER